MFPTFGSLGFCRCMDWTSTEGSEPPLNPACPVLTCALSGQSVIHPCFSVLYSRQISFFPAISCHKFKKQVVKFTFQPDLIVCHYIQAEKYEPHTSLPALRDRPTRAKGQLRNNTSYFASGFFSSSTLLFSIFRGDVAILIQLLHIPPLQANHKH